MEVQMREGEKKFPADRYVETKSEIPLLQLRTDWFGDVMGWFMLVFALKAAPYKLPWQQERQSAPSVKYAI